MSKREAMELYELVSGEAKWSREAERIEQLVAAGAWAEADHAITKLALDRMAGGTGGSIDLALVRAAAALLMANVRGGARDVVERAVAMFETGSWHARARVRLGQLANDLTAIGEEVLAQRVRAVSAA